MKRLFEIDIRMLFPRRTYCGYHCCSGSLGLNHLGSIRNWYAKRSIG